jgi:hypothetical protein
MSVFSDALGRFNLTGQASESCIHRFKGPLAWRFTDARAEPTAMGR